MNLGHTIKRLRMSQMLTQRKLAHIAGITPAALNHIELDKGKPSFDTLHKLAQALNLKVWEILKESDI